MILSVGRNALFLIPCMFLLTACGPGSGDLKGKISYKGKPLATGGITVLGSDGIPKGGQINDDGSYEVKEIAAGNVKISVTSPNPAEIKVAIRKKHEPPPPPQKGNPKWFEIPETYGDFDKSGLTFQLKRGQNTNDLDLK